MVARNNYNYVAGPRDLGVGVDNFALVKPDITPFMNYYGPAYNIHKSFKTRVPAMVSDGIIELPRADLRANGVYLSGQMALQALSDFEKGK